MTRPSTRGPLRVASFNVGLMSTFIRNWDRNKDYGGAIIEGLTNLFVTDSDATAMGRRVARRLLDAPYDVVVLNELFHADARTALVEAIRDASLADGVRYPWVLGGFGPQERTPSWGNPEPLPWDVLPDFGPFPGIDSDAIGALRSLLDDSGLLVASRLPLHRFFLGGHLTTWGFARYSASAGIDMLCPKGAAAVVVQTDQDQPVVVVVVTHLQADYGDDDRHPAVRRSQLSQLVWLAKGVGRATGTDRVLIMGDLNIRGEVVAQEPAVVDLAEYDTVFAPDGVLGNLGQDGWQDGARAPGATLEPGRFDVQRTHPESGERLDYVVPGRLTGRVPRSTRVLAVQHLMIATNLDDTDLSPESPIGLGPLDLPARRGHVHLSDHVGVNAIVGVGSEHSAPRHAFACTPPIDLTDPTPSASAFFDDVRHGELRWLVVEPGAYRIAVAGQLADPPTVDLEVYDPKNLSVALADVMPEDATPVDQRRGTRFPAVDHPLLVRLHARVPGVDRLHADVHRILGATPGDAVPLRPWTPTAAMPWPTPAQGGQPNRARWFEVLLDRPDPGSSQALRFLLRDGSSGAGLGGTFAVYPRTTIETPPVDLLSPATEFGAGSGLVIDGATDADLRFLVRVTPDATSRDTHAVVEVQSDLRWLLGASLRAIDETGPDWSGDDEITWSVRSDLHPVGAVVPGGYEDDVDTGEAYAMPTPGPLAFRDSVTVVLSEEAGLAAAESATFTLPSGEPADVENRLTATLPDDLSDGTYAVDFTWTRVVRHA